MTFMIVYMLIKLIEVNFNGNFPPNPDHILDSYEVELRCSVVKTSVRLHVAAAAPVCSGLVLKHARLKKKNHTTM